MSVRRVPPKLTLPCLQRHDGVGGVGVEITVLAVTYCQYRHVAVRDTTLHPLTCRTIDRLQGLMVANISI